MPAAFRKLDAVAVLTGPLLPASRVGESVDTPEGRGTVTGHNVPGDKVVVKLSADGSACACSRASVCGSRKAYEATHGSK
ncbi:MAG: hypothetical protein ABSF03_10375 [Streptosporangiaceae bacterium]